MKQRKERTDTRVYLKKMNAFHTVSYRILQLANNGLLRADFQHQVSKLLIEFTGCDSIELWLKDHDKYYPSTATRLSNRSLEIDFITFAPCETKKGKSDPRLAGLKPSVSSTYRSVATIPMVVNQENIGLLQLMSKKRDYFGKDNMELYGGLAEILGIASVHRHIQVDLRERVKELTCL